jgi:hypothetical protein
MTPPRRGYSPSLLQIPLSVDELVGAIHELPQSGAIGPVRAIHELPQHGASGFDCFCWQSAILGGPSHCDRAVRVRVSASSIQ